MLQIKTNHTEKYNIQIMKPTRNGSIFFSTTVLIMRFEGNRVTTFLFFKYIKSSPYFMVDLQSLNEANITLHKQWHENTFIKM